MALYGPTPYSVSALTNAAPGYPSPGAGARLPGAAPPPMLSTSIAPQPEAPRAGSLDVLGTAFRVGRTVDSLTDGAITNALGLDGLPSPVGLLKQGVSGLFGTAAPGLTSAAGGLATELGVAAVPGGVLNVAAPGLASAFPGLAALAPAAIPLAFIAGGIALSRLNDKPSVGPNYAVRFGRGADGGLTLREVGIDNSGDTIARDAFAAWNRDVLADALQQARVTDSLDGALVYFPNPQVTGGNGAYGARVDGATRYYATPEAALKAFVTGQHRQGRVVGDLPAVLAGIDAAIASRGSLSDAARPGYLAAAAALRAGDQEGLAQAERYAAMAQRAFGDPLPEWDAGIG